MTLSKYEQDMMGTELPEQVIVDGQPQEAKPETPVPTPPPDPETPPAEVEVDPITKAFREEGLDRQFKSPEEVLRKQREHNRYITQLEQERAELRRQLQSVHTPKPEPEPKAPITGEDLYADPNAAIDRLGVAKRGDVETVQQRVAQIEARQTFDEAVGVMSGIEELQDVATAWRRGQVQYLSNETFNRMNELYMSNPGLHTQPPSQVIPLLYNAVRGERGAVPTTAPAVDPKKKEAATTASGRTPQISGQKDARYYSSKSLAEIEKEVGFVEPN